AKEYPQEWIQKKSGKKVVLYHISESILAEEKQAAIEKAKRALQIFEENKNALTLLWIKDRVAERYLKDADGILWDSFESLWEDMAKKDWCIGSTTEYEDMAVDFCDAYYGDRSYIVNRMALLKKPIMIENTNI
ncbi:MAG: hypothetical protein K6G07_06920, partial [Lachnospiraceae bacterium]|nr:hypothetical protein [Lachnospiraceae bacterium]